MLSCICILMGCRLFRIIFLSSHYAPESRPQRTSQPGTTPDTRGRRLDERRHLEVADRIDGQNMLPYHLPVFYLDRIQSPLLYAIRGFDSITFIIRVPTKEVVPKLRLPTQMFSGGALDAFGGNNVPRSSPCSMRHVAGGVSKARLYWEHGVLLYADVADDYPFCGAGYTRKVQHTEIVGVKYIYIYISLPSFDYSSAVPIVIWIVGGGPLTCCVRTSRYTYTWKARFGCHLRYRLVDCTGHIGTSKVMYMRVIDQYIGVCSASVTPERSLPTPRAFPHLYRAAHQHSGAPIRQSAMYYYAQLVLYAATKPAARPMCAYLSYMKREAVRGAGWICVQGPEWGGDETRVDLKLARFFTQAITIP
ncbi:hypothetical protein BJ912DRAFT_1043631 [Pholiota molesta]|nr:hypothetical protein BJ912DRAFT_1043631 [Pholiota molesta]